MSYDDLHLQIPVTATLEVTFEVKLAAHVVLGGQIVVRSSPKWTITSRFFPHFGEYSVDYLLSTTNSSVIKSHLIFVLSALLGQTAAFVPRMTGIYQTN